MADNARPTPIVAACLQATGPGVWSGLEAGREQARSYTSASSWWSAAREFAVVARGHADGGLELAREGALVDEAAGQADRGDRIVAFQQLHGRFDAQLGQHLLRRELEYAAEMALELGHRHAGQVGQVRHADALGAIGLHVFEDFADPVVDRVPAVGEPEVARHADHAADLAAHGQRA